MGDTEIQIIKKNFLKQKHFWRHLGRGRRESKERVRVIHLKRGDVGIAYAPSTICSWLCGHKQHMG